jgi:crotonobetainyl-CoA:carnitine CoA-transferase CaiB-like acyl-CoA transferase
MALTGRADGPPVVPPGRAATVAAELAATFAAVTGVHVDGAKLLSERAAYNGHRRRGAVSVGGACRLLPTSDGWAAVSCARPDDAALLGALVGEDIAGEEIAGEEIAGEHAAGEHVANNPWPVVADWLRHHTGAELDARADLLGIAAASVSRDRLEVKGAVAPVTVAPVTVSRPLAGVLVADFSALWAGPLCAHLLGLAGATVVKVETPGARTARAVATLPSMTCCTLATVASSSIRILSQAVVTWPRS